MHPLVLPPFSLYAVLVIGLFLVPKRRKLGLWLAGSATGLLILCSVPLVSALLLRALQRYPALEEGRLGADVQAIVVLGADVDNESSEYPGASVGVLTLERLRYAAFLHRRSSLPILATGGRLERKLEPLADSMRAVAEDELGVPVRWVEPVARNTFENARLSASILRDHGVERVALVTHAWHMPRAVRSFEAAGLAVQPAPTGFQVRPGPRLGDFVPSSKGLRHTTLALHEWLGLLWYELRYW